MGGRPAREARDSVPPPYVAARAEPGSRRLTAPWFDAHERFYASSETSTNPWRLNLRHEAIFTDFADVFPGRTVVDIASHDGRWSLAAVDAGATSVVGIEARPELVAEAEANRDYYGVGAERCRFTTGDVFAVLSEGSQRADVVLCLGFFYHTLRYPELLAGIREVGPRHVVVDTLVEPENAEAVIRVTRERIARQGNSVADPFGHGETVLIGRPSVRALRLMWRTYGYRVRAFADWGALLRDNPAADGIGDYRAGRRVTLLLERTDEDPSGL